MRYIEEIQTSSPINFEFHKGKGANRPSQHRTPLGKPTPSKWDDAQKWLVNLSRGGGEGNESKARPRNSNADDRRLIAPAAKSEDYSTGHDQEDEEIIENSIQYGVETKNIDCQQPVWRIDTPFQSHESAFRSVCVRDMGTEMTPIGSQEPSRSCTPIRARTPISSGPSSPVRPTDQHEVEASIRGTRDLGGSGPGKVSENKTTCEEGKKVNPVETRATAWDEAERAKYMAR